jgi:hypothetical protein
MSDNLRVNSNFTNQALNTRLLPRERTVIQTSTTEYQVSGYRAPQNINRNSVNRPRLLEANLIEEDHAVNMIHEEEIVLLEVTVQEALQNINNQIKDISREIIWLKTKSKVFTAVQYAVPLFSSASIGLQTAIAIADEGFSSVWGSIGFNGALLSATTYFTIKYAGMRIEQIKTAIEQKNEEKAKLTAEYERIFEKVNSLE